MELFSLISFFTLFGAVFIFFLYIFVVIKKRKKLTPTQFIMYGKQKFNNDFNFTCEYCGGTISTQQSNCPTCSASYGNNKEYKQKRRETNQNYLQFLKKYCIFTITTRL